MSEGFIGQIMITAFNYAPRGYALCNGQLMNISQYSALFSLLSNTYGGDGKTTFALPNFQGCTPVHVGNGFTLAQSGGEANHTLLIGEIPSHTHGAFGSAGGGNDVSPANNLVASYTNFYGPAQNLVSASVSTISNAGGGQSHSNMQPYCTVSFCIALTGIFPSRP